MVERIVKYKIAQEIWGALNRVYHSSSIAIVLGLDSQLQKIKKENITISEYLAHIKKVFDKYFVMAEPLSYRDKVMYTLNGLIKEYDGFVSFTPMNIDWNKGILHNNFIFPRLTSLLILAKTNFRKIKNPIFLNTHKVHIHLSQTSLLILISPFIQIPNLASLENLKDNYNHLPKWFQKQKTGNFGPKP